MYPLVPIKILGDKECNVECLCKGNEDIVVWETIANIGLKMFVEATTKDLYKSLSESERPIG